MVKLGGVQKCLIRSVSTNYLKLEKKLTVELDLILEQEEIIWFQKLRTKWISSCDRNTKYFHRMATVRKQRNKVTSLIAENDEWVFDEVVLNAMVLNFYQKLYSVDGM